MCARHFFALLLLQQLHNLKFVKTERTKRLEVKANDYEQHNTTESKDYRKLNDTTPSGIEGHLIIELCMVSGVILA